MQILANKILENIFRTQEFSIFMLDYQNYSNEYSKSFNSIESEESNELDVPCQDPFLEYTKTFSSLEKTVSNLAYY